MYLRPSSALALPRPFLQTHVIMRNHSLKPALRACWIVRLRDDMLSRVVLVDDVDVLVVAIVVDSGTVPAGGEGRNDGGSFFGDTGLWRTS